MVGNLLAGTDESPGSVVTRGGRRYKVYRGMASAAAAAPAAARREGVAKTHAVPEGVEATVPYRGSADAVVAELVGGLRSAMSYADATTLEEFRANAPFVRITAAGLRSRLRTTCSCKGLPRLVQPRGQPDRPAAGERGVPSEAVQHRAALADDQVLHRERRARDVGEPDVHVEDVVEAQRREVGDVDADHGEVDALLAQRRVGVPERAQVLDARALEIRQVGRVMDDAHGVGLGEARPDRDGERVVGGDVARGAERAHRATLRHPCGRSAQTRASRLRASPTAR